MLPLLLHGRMYATLQMRSDHSCTSCLFGSVGDANNSLINSLITRNRHYPRDSLLLPTACVLMEHRCAAKPARTGVSYLYMNRDPPVSKTRALCMLIYGAAVDMRLIIFSRAFYDRRCANSRKMWFIMYDQR